MEYYSAIKTEILSFATTWMDLAYIMLSKIRHSKKGKYLLISLTCGIKKYHLHVETVKKKKKQRKRKKKKSQFHRNRKHTCGCQGLKDTRKKRGDADQRVHTLNYKNNF